MKQILFDHIHVNVPSALYTNPWETFFKMDIATLSYVIVVQAMFSLLSQTINKHQMSLLVKITIQPTWSSGFFACPVCQREQKIGWLVSYLLWQMSKAQFF